MKPKTTAQKILEFYDSLKNAGINLPEKHRLINPFTNDDRQRIAQITHRFYRQYYHDNKRRFMILTIQDTIARIGDVFLMLDETQPDLDRTTQMRTFIITPEEVARWAGLSAEATGDALRKFADQGRLEVYGDRIIVKNIVDLARFVATRRTKDNVFG